MFNAPQAKLVLSSLLADKTLLLKLELNKSVLFQDICLLYDNLDAFW